MRKSYYYIINLTIAALFAPGCRQDYKPPPVEADLGLLVIDGFLNNSSDTSFIRLTRTARLQEGTLNKGEKNASITINDQNGNPVYFFQSFDDNGTYFLPGLSLSAAVKYKLSVNTANGRLYESDEIEAKETPAIDSISWERQKDGVEVFSNAHDASGNTVYYRWDYTETWEYYSNFFSDLKYENGVMLFRNQVNDQVFRCWTTKNSTELLLASSAKLSQDIIYRNPIRFIPLNAVELGRMYSIFVRQYALTKDAFDYLVNLKKVTEQRGSIFDAQPTELPGNIHCISNPTEPVIGFIMASTMQTKRIFIDNTQVAPWRFSFFCDEHRVIPPIKDSLEFYFGSGLYYVPIEEVRSRTGALIGYDGGAAQCVDCRIRGGKNEKPVFWP